MRKPRLYYTLVQTIATLRRHLMDHVPVSDLCDEHQLSPTVFYLWQKQFFENGPAALERKNTAPEGHLQRTIGTLRDKLQRKNEVVLNWWKNISSLKKSLGNSDQSLGSSRYPRLDRRLHPALVQTFRDSLVTIHRLARRRRQHVPRSEDKIRFGQRV
jgi:transposase